MTDSIAKPFLEDLNRNHTVAGKTLQITCQVRSSVMVDMNFSIPGEWVHRTVKCFEIVSNHFIITRMTDL